MKNCAIFLIGMSVCLMGCGQSYKGDSTGVGNDRLTCLVLGYDSVIYYTGNSKDIRDVNIGKITDTVFMSVMFKKIKRNGLTMTLKPGAGGGMMDNMQELINLATVYEVEKKSIDSIDDNEEKAFGVLTAPGIKSMMRGEGFQFRLNLPKEESDSPNAIANFPKESQLAVLIIGNKEIYAYVGGDIRKGRKYTYQELTDMLKEKRSDKDFSVLIKPTESSTYKNTVDVLDAMTIAGIKHYALVDITNDEKDYLHKINQ